MLRQFCASVAVLALVLSGAARAVDISGDYLESRTCDVYTGPCFANAEVGLAGSRAIMAWSIEKGRHNGVDLSGLKVVVALQAANTLAFGGGMAIDPQPIKSVILVDEKASADQRAALASFAQQRGGKVTGTVVRVAAAPIDMTVDHITMAARLEAGREVTLATRKINDGDRCCTNEEVFYPPLAAVENSEPAYTLSGGFNGRGLGSRWDNAKSRSSFLATFAY